MFPLGLATTWLLYPDPCFSGRAGFRNLDPSDGGWFLNPMLTVLLLLTFLTFCNTRVMILQESEETMGELKSVYEREKSMLVDENKKLHLELERTMEVNSRLTVERRSFEEEYQDLRNKKEAVQQWEAQIQEIINWVSDEKDARGYLQV